MTTTRRRAGTVILLSLLLVGSLTTVANAATTLVLIHGLGASGSFWDGLKPYLEGSYPVLVYELHGHGKTPPIEGATVALEAAALSAWLAARDLDEVVAIGHGLGGTVALMAALEQPRRFARLILIDVWPRTLAAPGQREATIASLREDYDRFVAYQYVEISSDESVNRRAVDMALRTDSASYVSLLLDNLSIDLSARLARLRAPVLVIGSESFLPAAGHEREFLEHYGYGGLADFQFRRLEGTGHYLPLEKPTALAALLLVWLKGSAP